MGELNQFTPHWLRAVLARQAQYAEGARCLQSRILSYGGTLAGVAAMERWLASATAA
jgi:hypothetical protein